ncbi:MAG: hypothetical protein AW07_02168 [Candidatus Accumulibacter sp. SK-11]|nr:MAG: hypothetical protein AW07_02168 [Candidatus Accumulibacter sp. SK-11]
MTAYGSCKGWPARYRRTITSPTRMRSEPGPRPPAHAERVTLVDQPTAFQRLIVCADQRESRVSDPRIPLLRHSGEGPGTREPVMSSNLRGVLSRPT